MSSTDQHISTQSIANSIQTINSVAAILIQNLRSTRGSNGEDLPIPPLFLNGPPPASAVSIEAAVTRRIATEEEEAENCAICLDGHVIGREIGELGCKHGFHWNCIESWLRLHGSCPVCRFLIPVAESDLGLGAGSDGS